MNQHKNLLFLEFAYLLRRKQTSWLHNVYWENILQRSYLSPIHSKGKSQAVGLVYKISNLMQTDM